LTTEIAKVNITGRRPSVVKVCQWVKQPMQRLLRVRTLICNYKREWMCVFSGDTRLRALKEVTISTCMHALLGYHCLGSSCRHLILNVTIKLQRIRRQ